MYIPQSVQTEYFFLVVFAPVCQWLICLCFWERIFSNSFTKSTSIRRVDFSWVVFTWKKPAFLPGMARLSYLYTLRFNWADFVSWWMWFNGSPTKAHRHFLTSHECILLPFYVYNMHQDTRSARLIAVCKRTFSQITRVTTLFSFKTYGAPNGTSL